MRAAARAGDDEAPLGGRRRDGIRQRGVRCVGRDPDEDDARTVVGGVSDALRDAIRARTDARLHVRFGRPGVHPHGHDLCARSETDDARLRYAPGGDLTGERRAVPVEVGGRAGAVTDEVRSGDQSVGEVGARRRDARVDDRDDDLRSARAGPRVLALQHAERRWRVGDPRRCGAFLGGERGRHLPRRGRPGRGSDTARGERQRRAQQGGHDERRSARASHPPPPEGVCPAASSVSAGPVRRSAIHA